MGSRMASRREFIAAVATGAGAAIATSALPAFADGGKPALKKRISLAYQHIHIGLPQPFSVLHISDTHLTECYDNELPNKVAFAAKRRLGFGGRQAEALDASLAWARANADLLVHTGDLIDFQTEANLEAVRKFFGEGFPVAASMGNHEYQRRIAHEPIRNTTEYNSLSSAALSSAFPFDITLQSTVFNGVNFVTIDQVYGFVTENQVERFAAEVKKGLPIVLCMHVPLHDDHIDRISDRFWKMRNKKFRRAELPAPYGDCKRQIEDKTTRDFIAYLKSEPLLKGVLSGHLHVTIQSRFSPTAMQYVVGGNFLFHGEEILFT